MCLLSYSIHACQDHIDTCQRMSNSFPDISKYFR